jgi:hypothetical protein
MPKAIIPRRRKRLETEERAVASVAVVNRDKILEIRLKRENSEWLNDHRKELRQQYPDRYVAVFDRKVVSQNEDFQIVLSALRKKSEAAPAIAAIEFLNKDEIIWVL